MRFIILTTSYKSNPKETVWNVSEKFISVKIDILKKVPAAKFHSAIRRYFTKLLEKLFLETPECCARYYFLRNILVVLYIYHILHKFS